MIEWAVMGVSVVARAVFAGGPLQWIARGLLKSVTEASVRGL